MVAGRNGLRPRQPPYILYLWCDALNTGDQYNPVAVLTRWLNSSQQQFNCIRNRKTVNAVIFRAQPSSWLAWLAPPIGLRRTLETECFCTIRPRRPRPLVTGGLTLHVSIRISKVRYYLTSSSRTRDKGRCQLDTDDNVSSCRVL